MNCQQAPPKSSHRVWVPCDNVLAKLVYHLLLLVMRYIGGLRLGGLLFLLILVSLFAYLNYCPPCIIYVFYGALALACVAVGLVLCAGLVYVVRRFWNSM